MLASLPDIIEPVMHNKTATCNRCRKCPPNSNHALSPIDDRTAFKAHWRILYQTFAIPGMPDHTLQKLKGKGHVPIKANGLAARSTWGVATRKGHCVFTRLLSLPLCFEHFITVYAVFPSGVRGVCYACSGEFWRHYTIEMTSFQWSNDVILPLK